MTSSPLLLSQLDHIKTAWRAVQESVHEHTDSAQKFDKQITEDARFLVLAYCIVQAGNVKEVYQWFRVAERFVEYEDFEDAAAVSTMYSAFEIIVFEYSRVLV